MDHYLGMRISRVLARGISMYAYDETGEVSRSDRKDLCEFFEGKHYHAELNASYNIGARFFIHVAMKPLSEKKRLALGAKVPEVLVRTNVKYITQVANLCSLNLFIIESCTVWIDSVSGESYESRYFVCS